MRTRWRNVIMMESYEWLLLIVLCALVMSIMGCAILEPSHLSTTISTGENHAIEVYQEAHGAEEMYCFTTAKFRNGNQFVSYAELCFAHCLALPKGRVKIVLDDKFMVVDKYNNFCKIVDRVRGSVNR